MKEFKIDNVKILNEIPEWNISVSHGIAFSQHQIKCRLLIDLSSLGDFTDFIDNNGKVDKYKVAETILKHRIKI